MRFAKFFFVLAGLTIFLSSATARADSVLVVTPPSLPPFTMAEGGPNPAPQKLRIRNCCPGELRFGVFTNPSAWLKVNGQPAVINLTTPDSVDISVEATTLPPGVYTGEVTVSSPLTFPVTVPCTLTVNAAPQPVIDVSPPSFFFTTQQGTNPPAQQLIVTNGGTGTLIYSLFVSGTWLRADGSPTGFQNHTAPDTTTISVNTQGLDTGTYIGQLTLTASGVTPATVPVTLTVTAPPQPLIHVNPASFSFTAEQGTNPPSQNLAVTNGGAGTLVYSLFVTASPSGWLLANGSPSGFLNHTAPDNVTISVNTGGLPPGLHVGQLTLTASDAPTVNVPCTLTVTFNPPIIDVAPDSFIFTAMQGGPDPAPQVLSVTKGSAVNFNFNAFKTATWLLVNPSVNVPAPAFLTVSAQVGSLPVGDYRDVIDITATGAQTKHVPVRFNVVQGPLLDVSPTNLFFTGQVGDPDPAAQTVRIDNTGAGTLNWQAAPTQPWVSITPNSGTAPPAQNASVGVHPAGLIPNIYADTVTVSGNAPNSPKQVIVFLQLNGPTAVREISESQLPRAYTLNQNFPNPFNPSTRIRFALPKEGKVTLEVYSILGSKVATLVDEFLSAGTKEAVWNGTDDAGQTQASGIYFYRLKAGDFTDVKKMLLTK